MASDMVVAKAKRRLQAAEYYTAHPELREKNRLRAAERRITERARRRQWDPPRKLKTPLTHESLRKLGSLKSTVLLTDEGGTIKTLQEPRSGQDVPLENDNTSALCVTRGTTPSITSAECVAAAALVGMANAGSIHNDTVGTLRDENDVDHDTESLGEVSSASWAVGVISDYPWIQRQDQTYAPDQRPWTWMQTIQGEIAKLNSGPLTAPTAEEASGWEDIIVDVPPWLKTMGAKRWIEIQSWAENIHEIGPHGMYRQRGAERLVREARQRQESH
ncbi:hypothetical protein C8R43DRAFT_960141 [Mycena crocata]|nr:hypothetical protein C8R43DRAFT_960141 [Mycena crocata]